ncbi:hypothetical protein QTV49_001667 [Vibrio vulnificus]|nr:hypothetical protein [Vibrio vulnificus]
MKRTTIAAYISSVLLTACGSGGDSPSPEDTQMKPTPPILKAPSDITMNVRAEGALSVEAKTHDGKDANIEWVIQSGEDIITQNRSKDVFFWAPKETGSSVYKLIARDPINGLESSETIKITYQPIDVRGILARSSTENSSDFIGTIGSGYDSELKTTKVNKCTTGTKQNTARPQISVTQDLVYDVDEIYRKFSSSLSGGFARNDIVLSASMNYESEVKSRAANASYILQVSMIQGYDQLVFEHGKVGALTEQPLEALKTNWAKFRGSCGDSVIAQQTKGANLYIALNIEFNNSYEKDSFEAKAEFEKGASILSLSKSLSYLSEHVSDDVKTKLTMFAEGGDISLALEALPTNETYLNCSNNYQQCITALSKLQNIASNTSEYAASINESNSVVLESLSAPYDEVAFNVELSDIVLSGNEREAIKQSLELLSEEYAYQSYVERFELGALSEEDYTKNKAIADQFFEDQKVVSERVRVAEAGYLGCMKNPLQCLEIYTVAKEELNELEINNPNWPFILQDQQPKGPSEGDVWCLAPKDRNWGIVDIGPNITGHQYYEANLVFMKLREVRDDRSLGDIQYFQCHQSGGSTPVTADAGKGGNFISFEQVPSTVRWLNNPNNDYFLTTMRTVAGAGDKNDNRWLYHAGIFTKYENGYLIPYWNNKLAWSQDYGLNTTSTPYEKVPTSSGHQSIAAPSGGWINGISFTRSKSGNYPMANWSIAPFN